MEQRDQAILKHMGLYRLTFRPVLERLFFPTSGCGNVLRRLTLEGMIRSRKGVGGNVSYYQLTAKATRRLGLPVDRSTPFNAQALQTHIALLWYCCMGQARRFRLERDSLARFFKKDIPTGDHCLEEGKALRMFQCYVPAPDGQLDSVIRTLRRRFDESRANPSVYPWIETRQYGFAILVETAERQRAIREALKTESNDDGLFNRQTAIAIERAPGLLTLKEAIIHAGRASRADHDP